MESVRRAQATSVSQLQDEVLAERRDDTDDPLKCPRCCAAMQKEFIEEPASFFIDTCRTCELVWFDGGELARLQLSYEISPKGREAAEFQRRLREMTVEEREQFERNLTLLPKGDASVLSGFGAGLLSGLVRFFRVSS
jgi:Zn-finger nucleic acid-binding protein